MKGVNAYPIDYWHEMPAPQVGWDVLVRQPHTIEVGDIVHVHGGSLYSRAIRWVTRSSSEAPSWASHTALVLDVAGSVTVIDTVGIRVSVRPLRAYRFSGSKVLVSRVPGGLSAQQKACLAAKARDYKGRLYGVLKLLYHALDRLLDNRFFFRRLARMDDYPICSWMVAHAYQRSLGLLFGCAPNAAQPDDILDYCVSSRWTRVWADSAKTLVECQSVYAR
ncbi:MAG: hypothetical protein QF660_04950 [Anaerolineales bacterium]|nr:hypothetical protein [Anaerolineales bacterium]